MTDTNENLLAVLIAAGAGPRRKLASAIMEGKVRVNGTTATNLRQPVDSRKDTILLEGRPVTLKTADHTYLVLNKPAGFLSTLTDDRNRKTVVDLIPEKYRRMRLYPAGRLDLDSTGLLLLTNDGDLTFKLTHPRFKHDKEYYVHLDGFLTPYQIDRLQKGIILEEGTTAPAQVREVDDDPPYNYSITIHEGRKRQVRRMMERMGRRTIALKRVRIGLLSLGDLEEGESREIGPGEINSYFPVHKERAGTRRSVSARRKQSG